jgi:hypothetical protein
MAGHAARKREPYRDMSARGRAIVQEGKTEAEVEAEELSRARRRIQLAEDCISPRAYLMALARRSMEILHEHLDEGDRRAQAEASRILINASIKVTEIELQQAAERAKEEQIRMALQDPDDDLIRALRAEKERVLALLGASPALTASESPGRPDASEESPRDPDARFQIDTSTQIHRNR